MDMSVQTTVTVSNIKGSPSEVIKELSAAIEQLRPLVTAQVSYCADYDLTDTIKDGLAGRAFVPYSCAAACAGCHTVTGEQLERLYEAAAKTSKINAIKVTREVTRYGLKEAKELVESVWRSDPVRW
jgi:ribosomal protein L7/L12